MIRKTRLRAGTASSPANRAPVAFSGRSLTNFCRRFPLQRGKDTHGKTSHLSAEDIDALGGTAPYFHDGSAATLEDLVRSNRDRMGKTSQLGPDDQAALVAYLRSLEQSPNP